MDKKTTETVKMVGVSTMAFLVVGSILSTRTGNLRRHGPKAFAMRFSEIIQVLFGLC